MLFNTKCSYYRIHRVNTKFSNKYEHHETTRPSGSPNIPTSNITTAFHRFQCREIGYETHEEILRVLDELHTTMKTYQAYQTGSRQAETKLRVAEQQRSKLEVANAPPEKLARSKKYKLMEKEVNKVGCDEKSRPGHVPRLLVARSRFS